MSYFAAPVIFLLGFFVLILAFFIVKQQSAAVIERFGKVSKH
jgi:regulator of protease activity HflC (stomatin/prohibitin superfamily)